MRKTPRPHQQAAIDRFKDRDWMALFFQMRLGKTLVTIRWLEGKLNFENSHARVLVVCPLTPMVGWMEELESEGHDLTVLKSGVEPNSGWNLVTYQTLARNPDLASSSWDAVVLDESTAIKNPSAACTKICVKRLSRAKYRAILSGLPNPEGLLDVFSQMQFAAGGEWMGFKNYWAFRDHHCRQWGFNFVMDGLSEGEIEEQLHADGLFLSRKQCNLGSEKIYETRSKPADPEIVSLSKQLKKTWASAGREAKHAVAVATWLQRVAGGHTPEGQELPCWKYSELMELLTGDLKDEPVVVWFSFSLEMRRAYRMVHAAGIPVTFVQGGTTLQERATRRQQFQRGEKRVILMQAKCGKFGFDLSAADAEIYFSSPWSYEDRAQSEDRIESVGKSGGLLVVDLVSEGTADEKIVKSLATKENNAEIVARRILE